MTIFPIILGTPVSIFLFFANQTSEKKTGKCQVTKNLKETVNSGRFVKFLLAVFNTVSMQNPGNSTNFYRWCIKIGHASAEGFLWGRAEV